MTVLPRRVDTGGPRKATGDRLAAAARAHGCSMADIVRAACADILEPEAR